MNILEKQRKIWELIKSECIVNHNDFFIVNGQVCSILTDLSEFKALGILIEPLEKSSPYLVGSIEGIKMYVDPLMNQSDLRVILLNSIVIDLNNIISPSDIH